MAGAGIGAIIRGRLTVVTTIASPDDRARVLTRDRRLLAEMRSDIEHAGTLRHQNEDAATVQGTARSRVAVGAMVAVGLRPLVESRVGMTGSMLM